MPLCEGHLFLSHMKQNRFEFEYDVYDEASELLPDDAALVEKARKVTGDAYAPYSRFHVGAVAKLSNGEFVSGTNQENASYPVGICAERVLLGITASLHPGVSIDTMAISYASDDSRSDHPISPCGMCRQALTEYEHRTNQPIRLLLSGQEGKVFIVKTVAHLLPFAFTSSELI